MAAGGYPRFEPKRRSILRWSQAFIPTLRDDPAEAEAVSHKLLVRAGFIRQLMAGSYSLLPPAMRVRAKIMQIIREEIDRIGGQEFLLPVLHPAEPWQISGRWDLIGDELFRLKDRKEAELCLAMTHEEIFTTLALELSSYKQLPQLWYQIQTKLRDEPRPKSGVLRVREFTMKDSYSFDLDQAGLDQAFSNHYEAYSRIFSRLGMDSIAVEASSGMMGGAGSVEFMVRSDAGEDWIVICPKGDYSSNVETANSVLPPISDPPLTPLEKFATPGVRTIKALEEFAGGAPADRQIKSLFYIVGDDLVIVLMRGDHSLVEQKLLDGLSVIDARPATAEEIFDAVGAHPGSLGAIGMTGYRIVADRALQGRSGMTTGANEDDFHYRNVDIERDIQIDDWLDLREVLAGEPCITCGSALEVEKTIEIGHIFKLGRRYSEPFGATVLDENGKSTPMFMGSYGIGVERNMAAVVEANHDDKGIVWPVNVAPYELVVTVVRPEDAATIEAATRIYDELRSHGIDVILDDRKERPGVKFADAELVGFPFRITVGPRGVESGVLELVTRATGETEEVPAEEIVAQATSRVTAERR